MQACQRPSKTAPAFRSLKGVQGEIFEEQIGLLPGNPPRQYAGYPKGLANRERGQALRLGLEERRGPGVIPFEKVAPTSDLHGMRPVNAPAAHRADLRGPQIDPDLGIQGLDERRR